MTAASIQWIDCSSWELEFFGLPNRIPWPADADPELAKKEPFEMEQLLSAIRTLGSEAGEPWTGFLAASEKFEDLAEALEENEIPQASSLLDEIDSIYPGTSFSLFHRAYVARHEGREPDAIQYYREAGAKTPRVAAIWINLGAVLAAGGKRDEAVAAFREALKVSPNDPIALEGLASLREVVKLKANDPQNPNAVAYVDLATFHNMATQQLQRMVDPEQLQNYGEQLLRDGLAPDIAVLALERANDLRPQNPRTMFVLSGAYHNSGQPEKARELMSRYTQVFPQDPQGFFRLAQTCRGVEDLDGERVALDRVLELDPNFQPALGIRFELAPGEHDPAKEDALAKFGQERKSWMAYVLASAVARTRGDHPAALRQAERALDLNPEGEDALLHYTAALGDAKELGKLATVVRPAVESGKFSKRLDWNYAQVLNELGLTKDAVAALKKSSADAPEDFKKMAETMIDAWTGFVSGCGVRLEVNPNSLLMRPILITLPDGDGGIVLNLGAQLPAEGRFPWRATGSETIVALQQGHSGARDPRSLGMFRIQGIKVSETGPTTVECSVAGLADGGIHFRASQGGRKLPVAWAPIPTR
jgi:predicted Zn-dependent protease